MTTLTLETEPLAVAISFGDDKLTVELADGRSLVVPLIWYPRLMHGSIPIFSPVLIQVSKSGSH